MDRRPPQNQEAEVATLGAILLSDVVLGAIVSDAGLRPEHFYRPRHGAIYSAMLSLADRGEPVDVVTVADALEREAKLEESGGREYIHSLPNLVPAAANARRYAKSVREDAWYREQIDAARRALEAAQERDRDELARAVGALGAGEPGQRRRVTIEDRQQALLDHISRGELDLPQWPWPALNEATGGIWPGHLTVLGGITRHGKSVLLDQVLEHRVQRDRGARVGVYLTEMSELERDLRTISRLGDIPFKRLLRAKLYEEEARRFRKAADGLTFEIVQTAGMSVQDVARDIVRQRWDLVGVDLLNGLPGSSKTEDIDENVRAIAAAAAESRAHVIATNHLNRNRYIGGYPPEPTLGDLRGSGALADLATNVFFVYRFEELKPTGGGTGRPGSEAYLDAAKLKNGIEGRVPLTFHGGRMRFLEEASPTTAKAAA